MSTLEIRPVRAEELDDFLGVLCTVYEMPIDLAAPIFYNDPYFDLQNKLALFAGGRLVSALTLVESKLWIGDVVAPVAGIAGVATLPSERRKGYASSLIRDALDVAKSRGYVFAALQSDRLDYYRQFGFEVVSRQPLFEIDPANLPPSGGTALVRPLVEEDLPAMAHIYSEWSRGRTGWAMRDEKRWRYLYQLAKTCMVFPGSDGRVEGYLMLDMIADETGYRLNVLEWVCKTDVARQALIGFLGLQDGSYPIQFSSGSEALIHAGLQPFAKPLADDAPMMVCVPDVPRAIEIVARKRAPELGNSGQLLDDKRSWAKAIVGYQSFEELASLGELVVPESTSQWLSDELPRRDPFLPPADYF